jgi:hypothetical protein
MTRENLRRSRKPKKRPAVPVSAAKKAAHIFGLAAEDSRRAGILSWFEMQPKQTREWLQQIKDMYRSGKYPAVTKESLSRAISKELGVKITGWSIRSWLSKD